MKKFGFRMFLLAMLMVTLLGIAYMRTMKTSLSSENSILKDKSVDVYPMMSMSKNGNIYNTMYPYTRAVNFITGDSYTYMQRNEIINLRLDHVPTKTIRLKYEMINPLSNEVLVEGTIKKNNIVKNKDHIKAQLVMPYLESSSYPYLLRISYRGDDQSVLYYHQPFYMGNSDVIQSIYDTVTKVHQATFQGEAKTLERLLPQVERTTEGSMKLVESSTLLDQIMWRFEEDVIPMSEPQVRITSVDDLRKRYEATIRYTAAVRSNHTFAYWDYTETYTLSGVEDIRIEDYTRRGTLNTDEHNETVQSIWLDHQDQLTTIEASEGLYQGLIWDREIWFYDGGQKVYRKIFGFDKLNSDYVRDNYNRHQIKLASLDNQGRLTYMVYGYMNVGPNMAKNGVAIYQYNALTRENEEVAFIHMPYGLDQLEAMSDTFYVTEDFQSFYFISSGMLHQVKLVDGVITEVAKDLPYDISRLYMTKNQKGYMWEDQTVRRTNDMIHGISIDYNYVINKIEQRDGLYNHILGISGNQTIIGYYPLEDTLETLNTEMTYLYQEIDILDHNGKIMKKLKAPTGKYYDKIIVADGKVTYDLVRRTKTGTGRYARITLQKLTQQSYDLDEVNYTSKNLAQVIGYTLDKQDVRQVRKKRYKELIYNEEMVDRGYVVITEGQYRKTYDTMTDALLAIDENSQSYILHKKQDTYEIYYTGYKEKTAQIEGIPVIPQKPELPRGCEVTSLSMLLNTYLDKPVDKMQLAEEVKKDPTPYQVKNGLMYFGNVHEGFVGNMGTGSAKGYAVYHEAIEALGETYIPDGIMNITGSRLEHLLYYVSKGYPVWVVSPNIYQKVPASTIQQWITPQGAIEISYTQHAVLITGYDEGYIYFNDPSSNRVLKRNRKDFEEGWKSFGSQGLLVYQ